MSTNVAFNGTFQVGNGACGCGTGDEVVITFDGGTQTYGAVFKTVAPFQFADSALWVQLPLADELLDVSLLSLSAVNGTLTNLLIGAPPTWAGAGGVFPTGFVGGEIFTFRLAAYDPVAGGYTTIVATFVVTFTVAAQTASDVARAINAQLALQGYAPMATVQTSGQLLLTAPQPGQGFRLENVVPKSAIGYAAGNLGADGTGVTQVIPGLYLAEFSAVPARNFWLRGGAWLNILVAGGPS